jgi:DNA-binding response OmpR family regulator
MNEARKNAVTQRFLTGLQNRGAPNREGNSARGSSEPEICFDESLAPISTLDLKEIRRLSRFLPVIVFIPKSTARKQVTLRKITAAKSSNESSDITSLLGVFGKELERFKITSAESMFAFGDVTVSFSAMEALRKGEPVVLTSMEFKMLKYLIQNAYRAISRDELLNEVCGQRPPHQGQREWVRLPLSDDLHAL